MSGHPVILEAKEITKAYPGTVALQNVDFKVHSGAVNVLIGENGAGKSTLMKILAGVERPTLGKITLAGKAVSFASIRDAAAKGIGIVFQELNLCPNLTVTQNIFLGRDIARLGVHIDEATEKNRVVDLMKRLEHAIDPDAEVADLKIGEQQIVEIAKALAEDAQILIMDEPTSALSETEVEVLFKVIEELRRTGVAIIYISHRLEELIRIGDYFTVLRDGKLAAAAPKSEVTIAWIIRNMLGAGEILEKRAPSVPVGPVILSAEKISISGRSDDLAVNTVSVGFRSGEITAIYGLLGAGRTELFEGLYGLRKLAEGAVLLGSSAITRKSVASRMQAGLMLVPEDRQRDGLMQNLSVGENLGISAMKRFTRMFSIFPPKEKEVLADVIARLRIKTESAQAPITSLSGGNQQKVVIGKTLLTQPKVLLLDEPSRGIDIGAKAEVFNTMRDLADQGMSIVYTTSDLKETYAVADRILVMAYGRITADLRAEDATDEILVRASTLNRAQQNAA